MVLVKNKERLIKKLKEQIAREHDALKRVKRTYELALQPKEIHGIESYEDLGMPNGSRKEWSLITLSNEINRITSLIDNYHKIIENLENDTFKDTDDKQIAATLNSTIDQVKFLQAKGYNNTEIAEMIGISRRWVQKLLKRDKELE